MKKMKYFLYFYTYESTNDIFIFIFLVTYICS